MKLEKLLGRPSWGLILYHAAQIMGGTHQSAAGSLMEEEVGAQSRPLVSSLPDSSTCFTSLTLKEKSPPQEPPVQEPSGGLQAGGQDRPGLGPHS